MDLSRVKEVYPQLLSLLGSKGYAASTIGKYQWVINRFLNEAQSPDINSFEDYFAYLGERLSPASMPEMKTYLGTLKLYVETGVFYRDTASRTGFMRQCSYNQLNSYFKGLVDNSLRELSGSYEEGTVKSVKSAGSVFCLHFQQHGHTTFSSVKRQQPVLEYFHDGKSALRNSAHRYQVRLFLSANADSDPACATALSVPSPRTRHQEELRLPEAGGTRQDRKHPGRRLPHTPGQGHRYGCLLHWAEQQRHRRPDAR